jgi:DNA polymerase-1
MNSRRQKNLFDEEPLSQAEPVATEPSPPEEERESLGPILSENPESDASLDTHGTSPLAGKTVYVIDANSLIFQVFHAIPEMTSPSGLPVSAVFGFTRDLFTILDQKKPDYLVIANDRPEPTFRHELYPAYKGDRAELPNDLAPQFEPIRQVVEGMGLPMLDLPGYEADDVLATVAKITSDAGGVCVIVSADKDCRQLLSDRVKIFNVRKNLFFDDVTLQAEWGIRPDQVVDFQSLVGDSVDGIPGVPLVGPKVAQQWLSEYDTLDNLLANAEKLPKGKRKDNLISGAEQAQLSRRLARLETELPLPTDWQHRPVGTMDRERLLELFKSFGFHSLSQRIAALPATKNAAPIEAWTANYILVDTFEKLSELVAEMSQQPWIAFDTETTHIWPRWAQLVGLSFCWRDGTAYYIPVRAPAGEKTLDENLVLDALRPILENPAIKKTGQNLKYDWIVMRGTGVELAGVEFDSMIASYLLDAGERIHGIDELAQRYLHHTKIKTTSLIGSGKNQRRMDDVPTAQICEYACEDADAAWRLRPILERDLAQEQLAKLAAEVEFPLVEVLVEMESNGIRIDVARLKELSAEYAVRIAELEQQVYAIAGRTFNIGSPKQLQEILFEEHKLPVLKKTKTGGSTDAEVLEELARLHPLPAKIIEYRQFTKLKSTYIDALPELVHPVTGRVHSSFNQVVAATGRLSSSDPNLQNIPVRTSQGREIRATFLPREEGWQLVAADYSQIELRVLAHYSSDPELVASFERDEDVHARVAAQVNGVAIEEVTPDMRRAAKAVNFGVIYGQSAFGLAKQLDISKEKAAEFIDAYFGRYQGVETFMNQVIADCHASGFVRTILGRRRAISGVRLNGGRQRNLPERTAINTVIQGSAADLIKLAMLAVHRRLQSEKWQAKLLLQIHDELVFEAPAEEVSRLCEMVSEAMTGVMTLRVPLKVDVEAGPHWT